MVAPLHQVCTNGLSSTLNSIQHASCIAELVQGRSEPANRCQGEIPDDPFGVNSPSGPTDRHATDLGEFPVPNELCPPARAQMRADEFGDFGVGATAEEVADLDHVEVVGPIPSRSRRVAQARREGA